MSYYLVSIFRDQTIFASDRRIIRYLKEEEKVVIEKIDNGGPKYFQINSHTFFLGPSNWLLANSLAKFLQREFGDRPICLEALIRKRFDFQKEAKRVIEMAEGDTGELLIREGLTGEDLGGGFWRVDSYLCGVDHLGRPYLIDFRENLRFQIYTAPGSAGASEHSPKINRYIGRQMGAFQFVTNNRLLDRLPERFRRKFEQNVSARIFPKIIQKIAKEDFRVGGSIDVMLIDRNGSEILKVC